MLGPITLTLASVLSLPAPCAETELRLLDETVDEIRTRFDVPALAALTITSEGPVAAGVAGVRQRGEQAPVEAGDRFHLGSCTKAMTATLAALVVADGKLGWETTLGEVFEDLAPGMDEAWRGVTLDQLLSHTAGAPENLFAYAPLGLELTASKEPLPKVRRALVEGVSGRPPVATPGEAYGYSNIGYVMAAAMLEERTERSWEELMQERLFEPLGMASAGFGPPSSRDELDEPRGHGAKGEPRPWQDNPPFIGPAGTVHASLWDWGAFVRLHLRGARGDEGLLLEPATFEHLHAVRPGTADTYAAGWIVARRPWSKGPVLTHSGSNLVWFCTVWMAPEEDFAVLVACNQGGDAGAKAADAAASALILEHLAATR